LEYWQTPAGFSQTDDKISEVSSWTLLGYSNGEESNMKKFMFVFIFSVAALLLTACGAKATPEPLEVTITMTEYAYDPAELQFQVGQEVTLNLVNKGTLVHEIMFGRDMMLMDGKPSGYSVDMFETAGIEPHVSIMDGGVVSDDDQHMEGGDHDHPGFMVSVPVGNDMYSMTFTVTKEMLGEWEYGCFELEGVHYTAGMVGKLTVIE
jgi:plastocyanin